MCPEDELVGSLFADRFMIEARIGSGGMGIVYRATQQVLQREVALKLLSPRALSNPKALRRFEREARAACRIQHPNITRVHDFGYTEDGYPYLVMEFVSGISLDRAIHLQGPFELKRALTVLRQVVAALAAAHEADVIHRDLKPQNVLLEEGEDGAEQVKVLDFGISKICSPDSSTGLTTRGTILGTPDYMSPEQVTEEGSDLRSDIYSVGAMAHVLLTGKTPFSGTAVEVMKAHVVRLPPPPSELRPDLPPGVDALVMRCMQKDPGDRFADAGELALALEALRS